MYRRIETPYKVNPIGVLTKKDNVYEDKQGNVYTYNGIEYIKIGYKLMIPDIMFKNFATLAIALSLLNIFVPKSSHNSEQEDELNYLRIMLLILFAILTFYSIAIGWIVNKVIYQYKEKVVDALINKKYLRLIAPNGWFVIENKGALNYLVLSTPFAIIISLASAVLGFDGFAEWNACAAVVDAVCFIFNIVLNLLSKVWKY
ncbi:hypothetical protein FC89_GL002242 [Liquorilactobacillus ghanensis DSM 18630]|uniref:Uncharacterized protein n=1 Tax=Liquorilactobacillus ghanensis DSM 18630 TaxID=1423750 RepID=A0A0R1VL77_9LACO|nr:hypothetical protein [Liquorilactobacillus ghanensis]KRM04555.1 hypothetical protein FC89_GL002242 [Liquorilactobacillus ghanensis DSM 18630]